MGMMTSSNRLQTFCKVSISYDGRGDDIKKFILMICAKMYTLLKFARHLYTH